MMFLRVPSGTRSVGSVLHLISEDRRFGVALFEAGVIQGKLALEGLGIVKPGAGLRLLDRFAVAPMDEQGRNARVMMVPPYELGDGAVAEFTQRVQSELAASGFFDEEGLQYLTEQTRLGIEQVYGGN